MAISPSSISTRLPRTVSSTTVKENKRALALRLIDYGIITILVSFLVCFSVSAVNVTGEELPQFEVTAVTQPVEEASIE